VRERARQVLVGFVACLVLVACSDDGTAAPPPFPEGFVAREATGSFEPRALPFGFVVERSIRPAVGLAFPAGAVPPSPVTQYVFSRAEPFSMLTIAVFAAVADVPEGRERVSGLREVDVHFTQIGNSLSVHWTEGRHSLLVFGSGVSRAEILEVVRFLGDA
jgi:hypothetical protein